MLTLLIGGKFSTYHSYMMECFPSIFILKRQTWKSKRYIFHVCMTISNKMEIKSNFRPDFKLKPMNQVRQVLRYPHSACVMMQSEVQRLLANREVTRRHHVLNIRSAKSGENRCK